MRQVPISCRQVEPLIVQAYMKGRVRSMREVGGILNTAIQDAIGDLL